MSLNFRHNVNGQDLVLAISQDYKTSQVLMVAYMNREAFEKTLKTKVAHYWSTSREELWLKGDSSGHVQNVKEIFIDCDMDAVLLKVEQLGGACHEGYYSCFFRKIDLENYDDDLDNIDENLEVIAEKVFDPDSVY